MITIRVINNTSSTNLVDSSIDYLFTTIEEALIFIKEKKIVHYEIIYDTPTWNPITNPYGVY